MADGESSICVSSEPSSSRFFFIVFNSLPLGKSNFSFNGISPGVFHFRFLVTMLKLIFSPGRYISRSEYTNASNPLALAYLPPTSNRDVSTCDELNERQLKSLPLRAVTNAVLKPLYS